MNVACIFLGISVKWSEEGNINSTREISSGDCTTWGNIKDLFLPSSLAADSHAEHESLFYISASAFIFLLCNVSSVFHIINEQLVTTSPLCRDLMWHCRALTPPASSEHLVPWPVARRDYRSTLFPSAALSPLAATISYTDTEFI